MAGAQAEVGVEQELSASFVTSDEAEGANVIEPRVKSRPLSQLSALAHTSWAPSDIQFQPSKIQCAFFVILYEWLRFE